MLEFCETRKDRFAILDGPIVSLGDMPSRRPRRASARCTFRGSRSPSPNWFVGDQADRSTSRAPLRRKLVKCEKDEVYVPPLGSRVRRVIARVDTARRAQGAGERAPHGHHRPDPEHQQARAGSVQRARHQRDPHLQGSRHPRLGRSYPRHEVDPSVEVHQRPPPVHHDRAVDLSGSQWAVFEPNDKFLWAKLTATSAAT
jgi:hypothetical protein